MMIRPVLTEQSRSREHRVGASEVDEVLMRRQSLSHRSDNAMEQQPDGGASALMAKVKVASSDPAVRDMKEVCAPPVHDQSTDNC